VASPASVGATTTVFVRHSESVLNVWNRYHRRYRARKDYDDVEVSPTRCVSTLRRSNALSLFDDDDDDDERSRAFQWYR
jgi:hypothetical protein